MTGSENHPGSSFFKITNRVGFQNLKKIWLGGFRGQRLSHNFEPLVFKGGSRQLILINQGFLFFYVLF
jgi:hypothetical protein